MRPLILKGHERPITFLKYNREGDLIFSCSKDNRPTVWWSDNGERIGTFEGHTGAVWCCDVTYDSKYLITGSGDSTCIIWEVKSGNIITKIEHSGTVKSVAWAEGDRYFATCTDPFREKPAGLYIYSFPEDIDDISEKPIVEVVTGLAKGERIIACLWLPLNKAIMAGCSDGTIRLYDPKTGKELRKIAAHTAAIQSMQYNKDKTMFITASSDFTSKLFDTEDFTELKIYQTERPVNSAAISPRFEHVMLGGGQQASAVTTTSSRTGKFEVRFFNMIYEEEFGRVKGHFGPVNTLAFNPDGCSFVSGAEDGYIRLHHFDSEYFTKDKDMDSELDRLSKLAKKIELES